MDLNAARMMFTAGKSEEVEEFIITYFNVLMCDRSADKKAQLSLHIFMGMQSTNTSLSSSEGGRLIGMDVASLRYVSIL